MKREREKTIDECWEFWSKHFLNKDGSINIENLKKELYDLDFCHDQISKVYCTITGNKLSYSNYYADTIIGVYEQEIQDAYDEGAADITRIEKQRDALLKRLVQIKRFVDEVEENHNAGTSSTCELCHVFNLTKQAIQSVEGGK